MNNQEKHTLSWQRYKNKSKSGFNTLHIKTIHLWVDNICQCLQNNKNKQTFTLAVVSTYVYTQFNYDEE